jgi:hypothetical protein
MLWWLSSLLALSYVVARFAARRLPLCFLVFALVGTVFDLPGTSLVLPVLGGVVRRVVWCCSAT